MIRLGIVLAAAAFAAPAYAVSEGDFALTNTGNLVSLCSADPHDPLYTAAQNFCHGFVVGTYRVLAQIGTELTRGRPLVCAPGPLQSRNQTIADFVAWTRQHPESMARSATDSLGQYFEQKFPCS
jgi:hypothetical protein